MVQSPLSLVLPPNPRPSPSPHTPGSLPTAASMRRTFPFSPDWQTSIAPALLHASSPSRVRGKREPREEVAVNLFGDKAVPSLSLTLSPQVPFHTLGGLQRSAFLP